MARRRRGRNEGTICQRADGQWVAAVSLGYDEHGKRIRKVVYGATKQEAQEKLRQLQTDYALGHVSDADKFTVADFLTLWLETHVRVNVAKSTYLRYKQTVDRQLKPHLADVRLNKLQPIQVVQLYALLEKKGASARTIRKTADILHACLRYATRMQFLSGNPCADVARPRVPKREMRVWNAGQVREFLQAAQQDRLYALYVVAIDTGMREGELFALAWPDVDFTTGALQVQRTVYVLQGELVLKEPKTAAGRRRIHLSPFALDALHEHRKRMLAEGQDVKAGTVFCNRAGGYLERAGLGRRSFKPLIKVAGVPVIRFHDLRHTCATLLILNDVNIEVVSQRLGHEDIETTLRVYSHIMPTMQQRALEKMQGVFTGANAAPLRTAEGNA